MPANLEKARELFLHAVGKLPPEQWDGYVYQACAGDAELHQQVAHLLQVHRDAGSFLEAGPLPLAATMDRPQNERPGLQIGPYKLLEQIGEGGFGAVYLAEQTEPVRRKVALKILKPGMDSRQVVARFEAERQALAIMDHPNIAKVFDGGMTRGSGRPYFVMELVKGVPITEFCDQHHLTPRERLELFIPVCQAVQHAHQKGIIHRDLKPSNVLVMRHDTTPVVKVIDFGVAKALGQELTDKTLFTGVSQMIGTPLYMSPEQAGMSDLDIDTRSDIYSLGVLLYELLTGTTPFDKERLKQAAYDEMRRIIREEEPQKPSTRISTTDAAPSIAAQRSTDPAKLSKLVRGELDWIVMKALEKDRNRRYETANGFALDIQRYLADEPVLACPPSAGYRLRKFARRNKASLATAAMVAAVLLAGIIGTSWQAIRATREADRASTAEGLAQQRYTAEKLARTSEKQQRQVAEQQKNRAETALMEVAQQKQRAEDNFGKARRAVDEYLAQISENELLAVPGMLPLREELLKAALTFYAEFTQERADDPTLLADLASAHHRLASIQRELGNAAAARAANREAVRLYEQLRDRGPASPDLQAGLANAYFFAGRYGDAVKVCQTALQLEPQHARLRSLLADTHNQLAVAESDQNHIAGALKYHRQAFELREALVRDFPDHAGYLAELGGTVNNLGVLLSKQGKRDEALAMFQRAVDYSAQAHERAPHSILWGRWLCNGLLNVACGQAWFDRREEALRSYERLVTISRKRAFDNPAIGALRGDLCRAYLNLGNYQKRLDDATAANLCFRLAREVLEQIPRETPDQLFELTTVYAVLASPPSDRETAEPDEIDAAELKRNADLAMETLKKAVDAGYQNALALERSTDLDPLRKREDFQAVLVQVQQIAEADRLAKGSAPDAGTSLANRQKAVDLLKGLSSAQPGDVRHRTTLATTLHSIGVIQTGLKQFEEAQKSLDEALKLQQELYQEAKDKPQARLDELATRAALGQLCWESDRPQEAHRQWQLILSQCQQIATRPGNNPPELQSRIANLEWTICQKYGEMGLWELACPPLDLSLKTGQLFNAHWDCHSAHLLAVQGRLEDHRKFCQLLVGKWGKTDPSHVVWAATMNPQPGDVKQLLELADGIIRSKTDAMGRFHAATAYYRAGEYERALELMLPFREKIKTGGSAYQHWFALIYHKLGQTQEAAKYFEQAEARYLSFAERCLRSPEKSAAKDGHGGYWYAWAEDQAMRIAAWNELRGEGSLKDPWQHLIQARGYRLIGELEKGAADLAAADSKTPDEPAAWITRARLTEQLTGLDRGAEAAWQRAVEAAGDNPITWIQRGRWYAERGEQEKADADFAKAAALTPNELNKFLDAGWWGVGPYPANLNEFCPPEADPDPSKPAHVILKTGLSEKPVPWKAIATGPRGAIDLSTLAAASESAYVMTIVYSPDERTERLHAFSDSASRVWVNGRLAGDFAGISVSNVEYLPITLTAGHNVILVKVSRKTAGSSFRCQLGDSAESRLLQLAKEGLWQQAAELAVAPECADLRRAGADWCYIFPLLHLGPGDEQYQSHCREMYQTFNARRSNDRYRLAIALLLRRNEAADAHVPELMESLNQYLTSNTYEQGGGTYREVLLARALLLSRSGELDAASEVLDRVNLVQQILVEPVRAMIAHQRGLPEEAVKWLKKSADAAQKTEIHPSGHDWSRIELELAVLLREAESIVLGTTEQTDALVQRWARDAEQRMQSRDPQTRAYDEVIYCTAGRTPEPFLARARRLAELGQWDLAEADFNKALQLKANEPDLLAARAVFFADRGDVDKAAADYHAALNLFDDKKPRWEWGQPIDLEVARRPDVLRRLIELRPNDMDLLSVRIAWLIRQGQLAAAQEEAKRLEQGRAKIIYGIIALLGGDRAALDKLRAVESTPYSKILLLGLTPLDESSARELLTVAEQYQTPKSAPSQIRVLGLAQLRSGKLVEAAATLESGLNHNRHWRGELFVWPLLAITHWNLGQQEEARKWFARATVWMELTYRSDPMRMFGPEDNHALNWLLAYVFYREASELIEGPAATASFFERLARQGGSGTSRVATVEAAWQRAVDLAGDNPLPWIQRGRWYAESGEHEKADADFAKAAALTPDELNNFTQAGWWVIGPYPPNLEEFCPPELDADPSVPLHVLDQKAGLLEKPRAWRSVSPDSDGQIEFATAAERMKPASAYALAYVYCLSEQTKLLRLSRNHDLRVWINGQLVADLTSGQFPPQPFGENVYRLPIALRQGRNAILIKTPAPTFRAQVADTPLDRVVMLAEQRRFQAACQLWRESSTSGAEIALDKVSPRMAHVAALDREKVVYLQFCQYLVNRGELSAVNAGETARSCALLPGPLFEQHKDRLVAMAAAALSDTGVSYRTFDAALVHYRAGMLKEAAKFLAQATGSDRFGALSLQALIAHRAGNAASAKLLLEQSIQEGHARLAILQKNPRSKVSLWYDWASYLTLLREAEETIHGRATQSDALVAENEKLVTQQWTSDRETIAFDYSLLFQRAPVKGEKGYPHYLLLRGKRLAELGRFDDAEADFNHAITTSPDDVNVLLARAAFYAQRDNVPAAKRDYELALQWNLASSDTSREPLGRRIENELGLHDAVAAHWLSQSEHQGHRAWLWFVRGQQQIKLGNWQTAADFLAQNDHWTHLELLGPLHCLLGNDEAYQKTCLQQNKLLPADFDPPARQYHRLRMLTLRPQAGHEAEEITQLLQSRLLEKSPLRWHRTIVGTALYRSGRYEEALSELNGSLETQAGWQRNAAIWPLLAMTQWQLGKQDEARKWLAKSAWWIEFVHRASALPYTVGEPHIDHAAWLRAHIFHLEAIELIEGPAAAEQVRQWLAAQALQASQAAPAPVIVPEVSTIPVAEIPTEAARLHKDKQYEEAIALWTRLLAQKPLNPTALRGRAAANFALGRFENAIADSTKLADSTKAVVPWGQAIVARGQAHRAAGDFTAAIADFTEIVSRVDHKTHPIVSGTAEHERCATWLAAGEIDSLKKRCRELLTDPVFKSSDQLVVYVIACCKQHPQAVEDWSAVVELAQRCVKNDPANELYNKNLLAALCRSGQHAEALALAAEAFPEHPSAGTQLWMAMSHAALGRLDQAQTLLMSAEQANESSITELQVELRLMAAEVRRVIEARRTKDR